MAIQYKDGTFSETAPYDKIFKRFVQEMKEEVAIRALIVGSHEEVEAEKNKKSIEERLEHIEQSIRDMSPVKTILEIPTLEDIKKYTQDNEKQMVSTTTV